MTPAAANRVAAALVSLALATAATRAGAQDCHPSKESNEANLLAFYSVPVTFSMQLNTAPNPPWRVAIGADAAFVPKPDPDLRITSECFVPKDHTTHLSSVFPRPRVMVQLPFDILLEASYLPPVRIANATAHVFSAAVGSNLMVLPTRPGPLVLGLRVHGTIGAINGAITCSRAALRPDDPGDPCFGTQPSDDTFHPNMFGAELTLAQRFGDRAEAYLGGGTTWLRPSFQVGFRDGFGGFEDTRVLVNLRRLNILGGGALRVADRWLLTGQIYSSPKDATLARIGVVWEALREGR